MARSRTRVKKKSHQPPIMSNQNKPTRHQPGSQTTSVQQTHHVRGQIFHSNYPPPDLMEKYHQIDPSFPDRFISMAEQEGNHRRTMEKRSLNLAFILDLLGTLLAAAVVGFVLYVGWLFMQNGHPREGASIIVAVAVALAIAFLTRGKRKK